MFVRTTKASSSALANGEVTEDDLSNAEKALRRVGIEVRSDIDTFKSFDEIMGELYNKIDSLSEVDLSNIAYEVASTRQTNVFKMMIKSYGEYQEMAEKAGNAAGMTLENQGKYEETLEAKTKKLSTTMESFWHNLLGANEVGGVIEILQGFATAIDKISGALGTLGTIGLGAGLFAGFKNIGICV